MKMQDCFERIISEKNKFYTLNGQRIEFSEIASPVGLLPALVRRASQSCTLQFGFDLGERFEDANPSILGLRLILDDQCPWSVRFLFVSDAINDIIQHHEKEVSLDELLYD